MASRTKYDYETPYDIMAGAWTGHSVLYDSAGKYQTTGPNLVWIRWIEPGRIMRYFQEDLSSLDDQVIEHEEHYQQFADTVKTRAFDLIVDGKACRSDPNGEITSRIKVEGVESLPGTYLFHLDFPAGADRDANPGGDYYNNQYFINPNERHIIGPYVQKGGTGITSVIAQTFTRISYGDDIPEKFLKIEEHFIKERKKLS